MWSRDEFPILIGIHHATLRQIRGVLQPIEGDALAETDSAPTLHASARSIRIQGTTTSS